MTDVPNADSLTGLTRNRQILPLIVSFFFLSDLLVCLPFIYLPLAFSSIFYQFVTTRRNFVIDILRAIYWAAMWFVGKCVFPIYDSASGARRRIFFNETEKLENEMQRDRERERRRNSLRSLDVSYLICAYRLPKSKSILRGLCLLLGAFASQFRSLLFIYCDGARMSRRPRAANDIGDLDLFLRAQTRSTQQTQGDRRAKDQNVQQLRLPFLRLAAIRFFFLYIYIYITCNKNDRSCKHVSRESEDF